MENTICSFSDYNCCIKFLLSTIKLSIYSKLFKFKIFFNTIYYIKNLTLE